MDFVFTLKPKYRVNQKYNVSPQYQVKQNLKSIIVKPRVNQKYNVSPQYPVKQNLKSIIVKRKAYRGSDMFSDMGGKTSCGCGK